jgi:purine-binding chemotaxis protein CheW
MQRLCDSWQNGSPSELDLQVLEERARVFRRRDATDSTPRATMHAFIAIALAANEYYGIAYDHLEEILPDADISPLPCVPTHVVGVTSHRGELLTVINLATILGAPVDAALASPPNQVVVVRHGDAVVGLLVREVLGSDEYDPQALQASIATGSKADAGYFCGIWAAVAQGLYRFHPRGCATAQADAAVG